MCPYRKREVLESALEYLTIDHREKRTWEIACNHEKLHAIRVAVDEAYGNGIGRSWADACHYLRTRIQQAAGI